MIRALLLALALCGLATGARAQCTGAGGVPFNCNTLSGAAQPGGANDASGEYGIISQTINNGTTAGGLGYALLAISQKSIGASAITTAANISARDFNTSGVSSTTGGGVGAILQEVWCDTDTNRKDEKT